MKKTLVALAALSALGSAFADVDVSGGVKLYGVLDQGVQNQTLNNPYSSSVSNTYTGIFASAATSRLGVKASRDLGDGIKGVAQAEIELAPDVATLLPSSNRQAFVGLSSETAGTVLIGTMETTAYEVWGMDVNGRVEYKPQVWRTVTSVSGQDRTNNSIKYISPAFNGFTAHLMYGYAEKPSTNYACTAALGAGTASACSEFSSYALKFKGDNLNAAVVHDQMTNIVQAYKFAGIANAGVSTTTALTSGAGAVAALMYGDSTATNANYTTPTQRDIIALSYDLDGLYMNYIYARSYQADLTGSNTTNTFGIRKAFDKVTLAASFGTGTVTSVNTLTSATLTLAESGSTTDTTFGAYYNFDKSTSVYLLASRTTSTVGYYDGSTTTVALGARYNF
jgi:predicted porin